MVVGSEGVFIVARLSGPKLSQWQHVNNRPRMCSSPDTCIECTSDLLLNGWHCTELSSLIRAQSV